MKEELQKRGISKVDGILFDLGVSSAQFDESDRGFSYRFDARLNMKMNQKQDLDAYQVVNNYSLNDLTRIIRDYGEDPYAYQIAKAIVAQREIAPLETTFQLVDVIKKCLPQKVLKKAGHPAKQTFQAIRIEVNKELEVLETAIKDACELLNSKGRVAIITFNSLEDRIVKRYFNSLTKEEPTSRYLPSLNKQIDYLLVNKKVITASEEELKNNNRAKPAKLRIIERK
jgi:16S rRNA (cytosine1402-N4)-methyltransferase